MSAFHLEKLRGDHDVSPFDCGKEELNRFLKSAWVFYEHFNLGLSPTDPYHLFMLVQDLKRIAS
jgi:hypothetical protein